MTTELVFPALPSRSAAGDGRHRRSERSRARIVEALLELVHAGKVAPSAEDVALHAQVGIRSVFRHFSDMESLYREMSVRLEREFAEAAIQPFKSEDWHGRLIELIERRLGVFERIAPYRRAADAHRHDSPTLAADHDRLNEFLRMRLRSVLPAELARDSVRFESLDLVLSFEAWRRLRHDQGLSARRTREVVEVLVAKLLAD